jgi:hypothetical protein
VIANLSFSYGMYSEFPPIIVNGKIIEFREDELIIEVKFFEKGFRWSKRKPEIGDQISVNPYNCSLIPPTDWSINK